MATTDKRPQTAVLLAAYNGEKYIADQVRSIQNQTIWTDAERDCTLYIHDDGSADGTPAILARLAEDPHIVLLEGPATGSAKANFLWMLAQVEADTYFFSDQDDVWLPEKMERELDALKELSSQPACVFSDMYVVDEDLTVRSDSFVRDLGRSVERTAYTEVILDNPAAGCTMAINRALRDIIVAAPRDLSRIEMHDQYILALADLCGRVRGLEEPLVYYRQHADNVMGAEEAESRMAKVLRNVRYFLSGDFLAGKRAFHEQKRMLAGELARVEAVPEEQRAILQAFAAIAEEGKLQRMTFYREHDFSRLSGNVWMRLWV